LTIKFAPPEILGYQARRHLWPLESIIFTRRYLIVKELIPVIPEVKSSI
jgi:hypothetical protein